MSLVATQKAGTQMPAYALKSLEEARKGLDAEGASTSTGGLHVGVFKLEPRTLRYADEVNTEEFLKILEQEMAEAAEAMDFEQAAILRDQIFELRAAAK